ncbi:MAG: peptide deformylase [Geminicoccaceae bacterium]|nr:peptide deformylase [Geminicoccaceae bacterium]MCB9942862.1 peptide deformylase [Geminicoccaceae bacterium]
MSLLTILEVPDPVLKTPGVEVRTFDAALAALLDDMLETMYKAPGIGLAGPQVGVSQRIAVVDISENKDEPMKLVNPVIEWKSDNIVQTEEGCLSLPGQYADVRRPDAVHVRYHDEKGEPQRVEADGLLARCLQHELDHLDGILFTDHISTLKRGIIMRKLAKRRKLKG